MLEECKNIENKIGRKVNVLKNRERLIDIDIILYEDIFIKEDDLQIPHPRLTERKFVLYPLREIEPNYYFKHIHKNINEIINAVDDTFKVIKLST